MYNTKHLHLVGQEIRQIDDYSSDLIIQSLTSVHAGNYTCKAENAAHADIHTAMLTVSGNVQNIVAILIMLLAI